MEKCNVDLEAIDGVSEYEFPVKTEKVLSVMFEPTTSVLPARRSNQLS